jgi:transposase
MEDVLDVYHRPYDAKYPAVCLDEASKQLITALRPDLPPKSGQIRRKDSEDKRNGTGNIFMMFETLKAKRYVRATDHRKRTDFAHAVRELVDVRYPEAEKIVLVMDNLNTHNVASLYEAFEPAEAWRLAKKLEIHYTPKHGSWLNMAEMELSVLARQCLGQYFETRDELAAEVQAWQEQRNVGANAVNWQFTTADARIKLKRLYPEIIT